MERKFTDDEIEKALECICGNVLFCADCPYSKTFNQPLRCKEMCAKDALDLINRQKAEIERLQTVKKHIQNLILRDCDYPDPESYNNAFKKALERLHNNCNIKTEAIKGFAERLKQHCAPGGDFGDPCGVLTVTDRWIDKLVKEMTGENNGD